MVQILDFYEPGSLAFYHDVLCVLVGWLAGWLAGNSFCSDYLGVGFFQLPTFFSHGGLAVMRLCRILVPSFLEHLALLW